MTPQENAAIIPPLIEATVQEQQQLSRLIAWQVIVTFAVIGVTLVAEVAPQISVAVLSGGGVSILNSLMMAWRISRAKASASHEAQLQLRLMYYYATERFLVVMVSLALLLVTSGVPLAVLGGFVAGQAAFIIVRLFLQFRVR